MGPIFTLILVLAMSLTPALARAVPPDPAGVVKNVVGKVTIVRDGRTIKAVPNTLLFERDVVSTGFNGKAGVILEDNTIVSLGRSSRLVLAKYVYQPKDGNFALLLKLLRGTALYISGKIEKLAPDAVRIETPHAVVGVRGSKVLIEVD